MYNFGAGKLIAVPTQAYDGSAIAVPQPVLLGAMQDVQLDISVDLKTLYGSQRYPLAVGQGKGKIEIKAKYADISAGVIGQLFYGKTPTAAVKSAAMDVPGAVPASTAYTVTPTVPDSGTWVADLGVYNASTGAQLQRVSGAVSAGKYSVNNGVYTFAAADASANLLFSFEYTATSTTGNVFTITNDVMGYTPQFSTLLKTSFQGKNLVVKLNACVSGQLSLPMKNEDFTISDFNAQAFADPAGNIGYICLY